MRDARAEQACRYFIPGLMTMAQNPSGVHTRPLRALLQHAAPHVDIERWQIRVTPGKSRDVSDSTTQRSKR